ncbi:MAG: hypothetical protein WB610_12845, partial [Rhodomicrobium sp.]
VPEQRELCVVRGDAYWRRRYTSVQTTTLLTANEGQAAMLRASSVQSGIGHLSAIAATGKSL